MACVCVKGNWIRGMKITIGPGESSASSFLFLKEEKKNLILFKNLFSIGYYECVTRI